MATTEKASSAKTINHYVDIAKGSRASIDVAANVVWHVLAYCFICWGVKIVES